MGVNTSAHYRQNGHRHFMNGGDVKNVNKTIYIKGAATGDCTLNGAVQRQRLNKDQMVGVTQFSIGFILRHMNSSGDRGWVEMFRISPQGPTRAEIIHVSGIGYLSHIYRVNFFFDGVQSPFPVIMKVPSVANLSTISSCERFLNGWAMKLAARHNAELHFYHNFAERIRRTGKVHVPKLYSAAKANSPLELEHAFMLMEDLAENGQMASTVMGLDKEQVEQMIDVLALVHALSLSVPRSEELLEQMRFHFSMDDEEGQARRTAVQGLLTIPEGDFFRKHRALLERLVDEHDVMRFDVHKEFGVPPVLCHGDFWCNNMFLQKGPMKGSSGKGGGPRLYALLDWQFAHPNSGLVDFCRLVLLCSRSDLRAIHLDKWLHMYTRQFSHYCGQFGVPCPYDSGMVRWMFLAQYPSEMLFSFMILMNHYTKVPDEAIRAELLRRMRYTLDWWVKAEKSKEDAMKALMMD